MSEVPLRAVPFAGTDKLLPALSAPSLAVAREPMVGRGKVSPREFHGQQHPDSDSESACSEAPSRRVGDKAPRETSAEHSSKRTRQEDNVSEELNSDSDGTGSEDSDEQSEASDDSAAPSADNSAAPSADNSGHNSDDESVSGDGDQSGEGGQQERHGHICGQRGAARRATGCT